LTPRWAEEFDVFDYDDDELMFKVWDSDMTGADYLGKVVLKKDQFMVNGINGEFEMEEAGENIKAYLALKIKIQGQNEYPLAPETELEVTIEKGEEMNYGIRIDEQGKVDLQVCKLEQGAVQKYNDSVKADMQVKKSDFIVSVNGVSENCEEMMNQFSEPKVTMKLRRASNFAVIFDKDHTQRLGVSIPMPPKNDVIPILSIEDGLIKEYNDKCTQESDKILILDRIISVKGEVGSAAELLSKLDTMSGKFQVGIQRPHSTSRGLRR